ncbi:MAG: hypothetical protein LBP62_07155 [Clostridiales bacterium]|jgi:shikimate dehydrogenase|nr:hypothetical protein [Clostridiales bacterium]
MLKCGLIGASLKHSYSAEIHRRLSDGAYSYRLIEIKEDGIEDFIRSGIDAFNVTIPYKKTVVKFLDRIDASASLSGAVNTVVKRRAAEFESGQGENETQKDEGKEAESKTSAHGIKSGYAESEIQKKQENENETAPYGIKNEGAENEIQKKQENETVTAARGIKSGYENEILKNKGAENETVTVGYNTDFFGFKYLLEANGIDVRGKDVFILGDGGTTATVKAVLNSLGVGSITVVSRRGAVNYENYMNFSANAAVLINASPVGMYPDNGECLVDLARFKNLEAVADVIYNPLKTRLIFSAEERGIRCCSGLQMLVAQAKFAAELFTGKSIENRVIESITRDITIEKRNIVLIGMPGSGKSSIGRTAAALSGRKFIDTDEEIAGREGASIPYIFEKKGEKYFREREAFAVREAGKTSGSVISTGGGVVLNRENYYALKQNAVIIYVKRGLNLLASAGRPLSAKFSAAELFSARKSLYENFADYEIENDGKIADAVKKVLDIGKL